MTAGREQNVLFVTWDAPRNDYLSGLFLPIFAGLAPRGYRFHVLQFTWADQARRRSQADACAARGISYHSRPVLRRPVGMGSLLTAVGGRRALRRAVRELGIDVVMPRATLPALATMLAFRRGDRAAPSVLLDADGLNDDERVDFAGLAPESLTYRLLRDIEAQAVRRADGVITRSRAASEILLARAGAGTRPDKFSVVSNGRDAELFTPRTPEARREGRATLGIDEDAVLMVYAGSVGPRYCVDDMLAIFARVRDGRPGAKFLFLTAAPEAARDHVETAAPDLSDAMIIRRVDPADVPGHLALADVALVLNRPSFSMRAVFPTKLGEYLLCGLPVVANRGIGDIDALAEGPAVHFMEELGPAGADPAATWILEKAVPEREALGAEARALGVAAFGLDATVESYAAALAALTSPS